MKNFSLLSAALAVVFISLIIFGLVILTKENNLKYWGENLDSNAFWLHPQNYNLSSVSAIKHYEGSVISYTQPKSGDWEMTLKVVGEDYQLRETTVSMPNQIQSDRIFLKEPLELDINGQETGYSTSKYSIDDLMLALNPDKIVEFDIAVNLDGSRYISEFSLRK